ncbi:MAG: hypothetical protein MMC33_006005 [Icmadophila ericetorum]|nr:hypothetical protein [Icmadophila ericetorum]
MAAMIYLTLVVWIFGQLCTPQTLPLPSVSALPDSASTALPPAVGGCSACYIVADVAGIVFALETVNQTVATAFLTTIVGKNGTNITSISIVENTEPFSFSPGGVITGTGGATTQLITGSTVILSGVTLTSPTAYNVFTAYSITSAFLSDGVCTTTSGPPIQLSSAFSVKVPSGTAGADFAISAESDFINFLSFTSCSPGGENQVTSPHAPVTTVTVTSALTASFTPQPQMQSTSSASPQTFSTIPPPTTITPSSTLTLTTTVTIGTIVIALNTTTSTIPEVSTSVISAVIIGNSTFPFPSGTGSFTISLFQPSGVPGSSGLMHTDVSNSWLLLWTAGAIGIAGMMWIL